MIAFDHIENTANPSQDAQHLKNLTYRGLTGDYQIAGNPKLRTSECYCVLGMRLQDKPKVVESHEEPYYYSKEGGVVLDFVGDLYQTIMYGSEEGQIRTVGDEERTVVFYATVNDKDDGRVFKDLWRELKNLDADAKSYTLKLADFATPAIDKDRKRFELAKVKEHLMEKAGDQMKNFLSL